MIDAEAKVMKALELFIALKAAILFNLQFAEVEAGGAKNLTSDAPMTKKRYEGLRFMYRNLRIMMDAWEGSERETRQKQQVQAASQSKLEAAVSELEARAQDAPEESREKIREEVQKLRSQLEELGLVSHRAPN